MGGEPLAAFLSLAIGNDVPQKWVSRFLRGLLDLAREFGVLGQYYRSIGTPAGGAGSAR